MQYTLIIHKKSKGIPLEIPAISGAGSQLFLCASSTLFPIPGLTHTETDKRGWTPITHSNQTRPVLPFGSSGDWSETQLDRLFSLSSHLLSHIKFKWLCDTWSNWTIAENSNLFHPPVDYKSYISITFSLKISSILRLAITLLDHIAAAEAIAFAHTDLLKEPLGKTN